MMHNEMEFDLSVIVPVYNEAANINGLYDALHEVLAQSGYSYEIIIVDDGSTDDSYRKLKALKEISSDLKVIKFRKNFGQTPAMVAGIDYSRGKNIVTLDGDLQNDPRDIPVLLAFVDEGYDIISGWRKNRKDKVFLRIIPSKIANCLISRITGVHLHDYGCTLKVYRAEILKQTKLYGEMHRFIPAVANLVGVKIKEVPVKHNPRKFGKSKYGIDRTLRVILDLILVNYILKYMHRPIHFFGRLGFIAFVLSAVFIGVTLEMKFYHKIDITGNPLFLLAILFLIAGVQAIFTGVLAEMISRIYFEGLNKPIYSIEEILD